MSSTSIIREAFSKVKFVMDGEPKKQVKRLELYSDDLNEKMRNQL